MIVDPQNSRIEIGKRIEVDQAGADQGIAEIDAARDLARKAMADKKDFAVLENHFAVFQQPVRPVLMTDHPARGEQRATGGAFTESDRL
ncbi:hypothetical protein D3C78_1797330 [compost metagenome]